MIVFCMKHNWYKFRSI